MKRSFWRLGVTAAVAAAVSLLAAFTALAAGWTEGKGVNSGRWWYDLGNGSYYAGTADQPAWQWLDGDGDGISQCYAFDPDGWMYAGTRTPDGYEVDASGAWTVDGVVQTRIGESDDRISIDLDSGGANILVAYFSLTGNTEKIATMISQQTGGSMFEIEPANEYPESMSSISKQVRWENEAGLLPALAETVEDFDNYDVVFLGYPIWLGTTPPIINSFLSVHDFSGKTLIPFCTSGGSSIKESMTKIRRYGKPATILDGINATGYTQEQIARWLAGLNL